MAIDELKAQIDNATRRLGDGSISLIVSQVAKPLLEELARLDGKIQELQQQLDTLKGAIGRE